MRKLLMIGLVLISIAAMIVIGCERKIVNESGGSLAADATQCFSCHSDQDLDLTAAEEQWKGSKHASGDNIDRNSYNAPYYGACEKCHTNEGFLTNTVGVDEEYTDFTAIGCFTCHEPHTKGNLGVRVTDAVSLMDGTSYDKGSSNICASCHQSRQDIREITGDVTLSLRWGPHHSNHADMLAGSNAYEYSGYDYDNSAHTNATIDGCVDCHMSASADYTLGGHSWGMYDEDKEHYNLTGCNTENCHNNGLSDFAYDVDDLDGDGDSEEGVQMEVKGLLDELEDILETAGLLENQHPTDVTVSADSAGAVFNWLFVYEDRSLGVHNTEYAVDLLKSSINFMNTGNPNGSK